MELVKTILERVLKRLDCNETVDLDYEVSIALRLVDGLTSYEAEKALSVLFGRGETEC